MTRAIGLISGLDSILASRLLQEQGIEVIGYAFTTPFFGPESALRSRDILQIRLEVSEITPRYMDEVLKSPRYGFGRNLNPCIDCHAFMFRLAGERLEAEGARFLFSGEVLGERPFSQNKAALRSVARLSGYPDLILRPLSARLLEETLPEREGWVDRSGLLDIQGRARARQLELARRFGIAEYPTPGGGCLLTEPNFCKRLKDLLHSVPSPAPRELELLKLGRHFRWDERHKIVVGRRHEENEKLERLRKPGDATLEVKRIPGPIVLVLSTGAAPSSEALEFAARLAVRYSDAPRNVPTEVALKDGAGRERVLAVAAAEEQAIRERMI